MPIHRINLKGPWEYEWIEPSDPPSVDDSVAPLPATGRVHLPADWVSLFGPRGGTVRWTRRFQRPTNLEPTDRLWIGFAGIGGAARMTIGETPIGRASNATDARFEITSVIERTNVLTVDVAYDPGADGGPGGLYGVVTVEIESE